MGMSTAALLLSLGLVGGEVTQKNITETAPEGIVVRTGPDSWAPGFAVRRNITFKCLGDEINIEWEYPKLSEDVAAVKAIRINGLVLDEAKLVKMNRHLQTQKGEPVFSAQCKQERIGHGSPTHVRLVLHARGNDGRATTEFFDLR